MEISDVNGAILVGSDADDEGLEGEPVGDDPCRIALEEEGAVVKRIVDPKLPSQKEVEDHCLRGICHIEIGALFV